MNFVSLCGDYIDYTKNRCGPKISSDLIDLYKNVSFYTTEQFKMQLDITFDLFLKNYQQDEKYIIYVQKAKSSSFVLELLLLNRKLPDNIEVFYDQNPEPTVQNGIKYDYLVLDNFYSDVTHMGIYNVILLDDASYSGIQISSYADDFLAIGFNVNVIIPFMTTLSIERLNMVRKIYKDQYLKIYYSNIMRTINQLDLKNNSLVYKEKSGEIFRNGDIPLTLFEFKIPDRISFPLALVYQFDLCDEKGYKFLDKPSCLNIPMSSTYKKYPLKTKHTLESKLQNVFHSAYGKRRSRRKSKRKQKR